MKLWHQAKNFAKRKGLGDDAEDFASELILKKLKGSKQNFSQFYKDYLDRINAEKRRFDNPRYSSYLREFSAPLVFSHAKLEFPKEIGLTLKQKLLIEMYTNQQMTMKEIGAHFSRSESTVSRWFSDIGYRILKSGVNSW